MITCQEYILSDAQMAIVKRNAEQIIQYVREHNNLEKTAAICGCSTMTVTNIVKDRQQVRYYDTAVKIIRSYDANKDKKITVEKNPDAKLKLWDVRI